MTLQKRSYFYLFIFGGQGSQESICDKKKFVVRYFMQYSLCRSPKIIPSAARQEPGRIKLRYKLLDIEMTKVNKSFWRGAPPPLPEN